ncbi:IclR family transcriptional regulator [Nakamurella leprariae]|uniref:IclR family transcriptional regulator n=1 Tax=Nakamurella leprariae TaxID=2803911 RepID=A0A939BWF2_9ACTN|nr:IclR family transcriptional regulator [Nakamurella leprariae]MBM9467483.1 IclR family transcriptional regulator [Nakamurella leprariae]
MQDDECVEPEDAERFNGELRPRMPALRQGIAALRLLASSTHPLPASSISRRIGMPRSSTYQLLQVLIEEGFVVRIPESRGYLLGQAALDLGSAYLRHEPLENLARPIVSRVAATVQHTTHLAVLYGNDSLYLLKESPIRRISLVTDVGVRLPAHLTATGRSMLCWLPREQVLALFAMSNNLVERTGVGPKTYSELRTFLQNEQIRGWSHEAGFIAPGLSSVAAAVRDKRGLPVASIGVTFPTRSANDSRLGELATHVMRAATALSRRLG